MTDTDARPDAATNGAATAGTAAGSLRPGGSETQRPAKRVDRPPHRPPTPQGVSPPNRGVGGVVRVGTADDVTEAMARARVVQKAWAAKPIKERAAVLLRYHDLVLDQQESLLDLIQAENGKARVWAFEEILDQAVTAHYYG